LPIATYAEQAAAMLRTLGVPDRDIAVVPAPASARDRTFTSAVALREWISRSGVDTPALDIVSEGPHARRTWHLYRMAFGDGVAIGIRSVASDLYPPPAWWRSSAGAKDVLTEAIAWAWVVCFFHPPPSGAYPKTSDLGWEFPAVSASGVAARLHQQKGSADASMPGLRSRDVRIGVAPQRCLNFGDAGGAPPSRTSIAAIIGGRPATGTKSMSSSPSPTRT